MSTIVFHPFYMLLSLFVECLIKIIFRFEKCLKMGMKLEAIREDRTRGGRSTYQCSYTIPQVRVPYLPEVLLYHSPGTGTVPTRSAPIPFPRYGYLPVIPFPW